MASIVKGQVLLPGVGSLDRYMVSRFDRFHLLMVSGLVAILPDAIPDESIGLITVLAPMRPDEPIRPAGRNDALILACIEFKQQAKYLLKVRY